MALVATGLWELIESKGAGFAVGLSTSTHEAPHSQGWEGQSPLLEVLPPPFQ